MNEDWRNELVTKGAAFDALTEIENQYEFEDGHDHLMGWAKTKIFALPSAQPKKVCVAEIKIDGDEMQKCVDKAVNRILYDAYQPLNQWKEDRKAIIDLPSVQETHDKRTETHARDCVSGVAAIIAAIEAVDEWDGGYNMQRANMIRDAIKALPSEQPQRMNGKWIDVTKTGGAELWKCSECGELELEDSYFCPNCGADMRGEEDA